MHLYATAQLPLQYYHARTLTHTASFSQPPNIISVMEGFRKKKSESVHRLVADAHSTRSVTKFSVKRKPIQHTANRHPALSLHHRDCSSEPSRRHDIGKHKFSLQTQIVIHVSFFQCSIVSFILKCRNTLQCSKALYSCSVAAYYIITTMTAWQHIIFSLQ